MPDSITIGADLVKEKLSKSKAGDIITLRVELTSVSERGASGTIVDADAPDSEPEDKKRSGLSRRALAAVGE